MAGFKFTLISKIGFCTSAGVLAVRLAGEIWNLSAAATMGAWTSHCVSRNDIGDFRPIEFSDSWSNFLWCTEATEG